MTETNAAFEKIVRIGVTVDAGNLYCKIAFDGVRLSITGVEGPMANGDARGGCGQIVMHEWDIKQYAPGWDAEKVKVFRALWNKWHLNDMQAGSPAQMAWLEANPDTVEKYKEYTGDSYRATKAALESAGLEPDAGYMRDGRPYTYGKAWLFVEVPAITLEFLRSLPDTDKQPAWV